MSKYGKYPTNEELEKMRTEREKYNMLKDSSVIKKCSGTLQNRIRASRLTGISTSTLEIYKSIEE
ncbi:MAG: hypothetical protein ACRC30_08305 [Clostridium sp.]